MAGESGFDAAWQHAEVRRFQELARAYVLPGADMTATAETHPPAGTFIAAEKGT